MDTPFEGTLHFSAAPDTLLTPEQVLSQIKWRISAYNAPYLAGIAKKPIYKYSLLPLTPREDPILPPDWSEEHTKSVIGDISDQIKPGSGYVIADTLFYVDAVKTLSTFGYRPAKAGEFLQLLYDIKENYPRGLGYLFCLEGRMQDYAISAYNSDGNTEIIFDIYVEPHERGYISRCCETCYIFVPKES